MPVPAVFLMLAALLPLAAFVALLLFGRRMGGATGGPLAGWIATALITGSFACSMVAMVSWYNPHTWRGVKRGMGEYPIHRDLPWIPIASANSGTSTSYLSLGVYVDSLTIAMFAMVTLVAVLVHFFTLGWIRRDDESWRLFAILGLATSCTLWLMLAGTLVQVLVFWELVGCCAYLLQAFGRQTSGGWRGAARGWVSQLIGDGAFVIGLGILVSHLGNAGMAHVWSALGGLAAAAPTAAGSALAAASHVGAASSGSATFGRGNAISGTLLTLTGLALFGGAMGRCAQFPLQGWLADSIENPPPAAALTQTVTATAAGIYLVARIYPILTPDARLFIAIIGVTTLTMGGLIALAQSDIRRVLAWSTVSQMGFIMLAFGVGSWIGAIFLLITHAFAKSLLILGAASVMAGARLEPRLAGLGGLWRRMPVTAATFGVGVLAMAGMPLLSGYYSHGVVLSHAAAFAQFATHAGGRAWGYRIFFALPMAMMIVGAFYLARVWMLTFAGKPRDPGTARHAREYPAMWLPLTLLAGLSIISGYALNIPDLLRGAVAETRRAIEERAPAGAAIGASIMPRSVSIMPGSASIMRPGASTMPRGANGAPSRTSRDSIDPKIAPNSASIALADQHVPLSALDETWPMSPRSAAASGAELVEPAESSAMASPAALAHERGEALALAWMRWGWLVGIALAVAIYWGDRRIACLLGRALPVRWVGRWLGEAMFFDDLYEWTLVKLILGTSSACAAFDEHVLGGISNGAVRLGRKLALRGRSRQVIARVTTPADGK